MIRFLTARLDQSWIGRLHARGCLLLRPVVATRSISNSADEIFTKLTDENDPKRNAFFNYSWGSWLVNDKQEKAKRVTRFSIEGLTDILNELYVDSRELARTIKGDGIPAPNFKSNATVTLPHNITVKNFGTVNPNEKVRVIRMASIHEGKHHRIYKVDTNLDRSFVLRIPYPLENGNVLETRLKSEVATMDFGHLKLGINIPKVYCYGANALNPLRQPFILEEYIEGKLLMRDWNPLVDDKKDSLPDDILKSVIEQVSDLQSKLLLVKFNEIGSLFFSQDHDTVDPLKDPPYENESRTDLQGRWVVGPTTERVFWRKKSSLNKEALSKFLGPWPTNEPLEIVKNTGLVEAENAKARLALKQAGASPDAVDESTLREQIISFENLVTLGPHLFNPETTIPNIKELLKPRLYHPDLDPMNIIITEKGIPYLLDFEGSSVKPFILHNSPQFVAYDGPKVFDLEDDVPDYNKLADSERAQYQFMYKRTRNQFLWDSALNERNGQLISAVAPPVKLLRSPYIAAVERKSDEEYLLIDEALIQLSEVWDVFFKNGLVKDAKYPLRFSEDQLKKHASDLNSFHEKLISKPFAATQGWVPQDMFENLLRAGILVKDDDNNYTVRGENVNS